MEIKPVAITQPQIVLMGCVMGFESRLFFLFENQRLTDRNSKSLTLLSKIPTEEDPCVSMPSWNLFDAQPQAYREEVLPTNVSARLAVEAGSPQGWHRYVGDRGDVIGIERFGASAPAEVLLREYGFTVDNVCARAKALL